MQLGKITLSVTLRAAVEVALGLGNLADDAADALHLKAHGVDLGANSDTVAAWERVWSTTLAWSERNPLLFIAVLALLGWAFWLNQTTQVEKARLKIEYEERRREVRDSLDEPTLRLTGGTDANSGEEER